MRRIDKSRLVEVVGNGIYCPAVFCKQLIIMATVQALSDALRGKVRIANQILMHRRQVQVVRVHLRNVDTLHDE